MSLEAALKFWQSHREERVNKVLVLTKQINNFRLPAAERAKLNEGTAWQDDAAVSGAGAALSWLYKPVLDEVVGEWVARQ